MSPCIDPTGRDKEEEQEVQEEQVEQNVVIEDNQEEVTTVEASVGVKAPDFETTALVDGDFEQVKLSDYEGQWVVLCFFPADFTFV